MTLLPTVAVTGASGFLGSHLVHHLRMDGYPVRALVRPGRRHDHSPDLGVTVVTGDIRDEMAVRKVAAGAEILVHLVSNFRVASDSPDISTAINVRGTRHALEAAAAAGVRRFVHCSTIGVHGDVQRTPADEEAPFRPGDVYQSTKLEAEKLVRAYGGAGNMEVTIVRPCSMYGPGDLRMLKLFQLLRQRRFMLVGRCDANFHAVFIDDIVDGFRRAMTHPAAAGQTFIIGGREYLPLREYVELAARAVESPMPWLRLPYMPMYALSAMCEAICTPLRIEPPLHRRRIRFFRNNRAFSIQKARSLLAFEPRVDLAEGMRRTVAWYRLQGLLPHEGGPS